VTSEGKSSFKAVARDGVSRMVFIFMAVTVMTCQHDDGTGCVPEICGDGIDNDCDGDTDSWDSDCSSSGEFCSDGVDNDGDGNADCWDTDCGFEGPLEVTCSDGLDNDCDGNTDAWDGDCPTTCPGYSGDYPTCCSNHDPCEWANDDRCDCDGACAWETECVEEVCVPEGSTETNCIDGRDNDCDGDEDAADDDCRTTCPGYTGDYAACCANHDPCDWANDGDCDCEGACAWEIEECSGCTCLEGQFACLDDSTIQICTDGCHWTVEDCDGICTDGGYDFSTGCSYSSASGHDVCWCDSAPPDCSVYEHSCGEYVVCCGTGYWKAAQGACCQRCYDADDNWETCY
jgi:hypothetical protein